MIDLLNRYHNSWIENHTEPDLHGFSDKENEGYSDISYSDPDEVSSEEEEEERDGSSFIEKKSGEGGMVGDVLKGEVDTHVATTMSKVNLMPKQQLIQ